MKRFFQHSLWIIYFVILSFNSTVSFAANADQNTILDFRNQFPVGSVITSGEIIVRDAAVPLPEGPWIVVYSGGVLMNSLVTGGILINSHNVADGILMLANIKEGKVIGLVSISKRIHPLPADSGYADISQTCTQSDVFYLQAVSKYTHTQDCWLINHVRLIPQKNMSSFWADFYSYMKENKIKVPKTFITGQFLKVRKQNYLNVIYYWAPSADKIAPSAKTAWAESDWNIIQIHQFPEKEAYLNKVKMMAEELYLRMPALQIIYP